MVFTDTEHAGIALDLEFLQRMWQGQALERIDLPPVLAHIQGQEIWIAGRAEPDDLEHLSEIISNSPLVSNYTVHVVARYSLRQLEMSPDSAQPPVHAWSSVTKADLQIHSTRVRSRRRQLSKRDKKRHVPKWAQPRQPAAARPPPSDISFMHITQEACTDYKQLAAQERSIVDRTKHKGKGMPKLCRASHGGQLINVLPRSPRLLSYMKNNFEVFKKSLLMAIVLAERDVKPEDGPGSHRTALLRHLREVFVHRNDGQPGEEELQRYRAIFAGRR